MQCLQWDDVFRLRPLLSFTDGELDLLAFFQGLTAFADNIAKVNENIFLILARNKPITFFVIEPLNGSDTRI